MESNRQSRDEQPFANVFGSGSGHLQQDCQSAHQQAIEESVRGSISNAFIPQCDEFGDYRPVQCHKVLHYLA